jgi:hypothetical protein
MNHPSDDELQAPAMLEREAPPASRAEWIIVAIAAVGLLLLIAAFVINERNLALAGAIVLFVGLLLGAFRRFVLPNGPSAAGCSAA